MGPRAGLDRCGKSRPRPEFDPRTVHPVASKKGSSAGIKTTNSGTSSSRMGNYKYKTSIKKRNCMEFKAKLVFRRISTPMPRELLSNTIFVIRLCTILCLVY